MGKAMLNFKHRSVAVAIFLATVSSVSLAVAAGGGAGGAGGAAGSSGAAGASAGAGVGASGAGSAAVGGGAPAGRVGGGPPAGAVGGGAPGSNNAEGNGSAGTGDPSRNAAGTTPTVPADNPASGLENAPTTGGVIGGTTGVPPASGSAPTSPPITGQAQPAVAPKGAEGIAEQTAPSRVGRVEPTADGVGTKTVAPRPCGTAAHEADGATTCVGFPSRK
jgi:hypothetical protein